MRAEVDFVTHEVSRCDSLQLFTRRHPGIQLGANMWQLIVDQLVNTHIFVCFMGGERWCGSGSLIWIWAPGKQDFATRMRVLVFCRHVWGSSLVRLLPMRTVRGFWGAIAVSWFHCVWSIWCVLWRIRQLRFVRDCWSSWVVTRHRRPRCIIGERVYLRDSISLFLEDSSCRTEHSSSSMRCFCDSISLRSSYVEEWHWIFRVYTFFQIDNLPGLLSSLLFFTLKLTHHISEFSGQLFNRTVLRLDDVTSADW